MATTLKDASGLPELAGFGTFLNRNVWEGEKFGGMTIDDYLKKIQKYDPNARIVTDQGAENGSTKRIEYDVTKLPDYDKQHFSNAEINRGFGEGGNEGPGGLWQVPDEQLTNYAENNKTFGASVDNRLQRESHNLGDVNVWGPIVMSLITGGAAMGAIPAAAGMTAAEAAALTGAVTTGATAGAAAPLAAGATTGGLTAGQGLSAFNALAKPTVTGDWSSLGPNAAALAASYAGVPAPLISLGRAAYGMYDSNRKNPGGGR